MMTNKSQDKLRTMAARWRVTEDEVIEGLVTFGYEFLFGAWWDEQVRSGAAVRRDYVTPGWLREKEEDKV